MNVFETPVVPEVPAIALPLDGKSEFVWPQSQSAHIESLAGRVGRVLTVGWRAAETHFLDVLRRLVRPGAFVLGVTGGESATTDWAEIHERLSSQIPHAGEMRMVDLGFSGLFDTREFVWLLRT